MDDYESLSHTKWECKYHVGAHVKVNKSEQWPDGLGRGSYALEGEV